MTYRLPKKDLDQTLRSWVNQAEVFAPQKREGYAQFLPWGAGAELLLDEPHNTRFPPKDFFLPQSETLLTYNRKLSQLEMPSLHISPRIIFGIRPCDARAVALLDTVFATADNPDPYWQARREQTILIGVGCNQPATTCFCTSVGSSPFDHAGLDALLTDLGEAYLVETFTERGEALFANLHQPMRTICEQASNVQEQAEALLGPAFSQITSKTIWTRFSIAASGVNLLNPALAAGSVPSSARPASALILWTKPSVTNACVTGILVCSAFTRWKHPGTTRVPRALNAPASA